MKMKSVVALAMAVACATVMTVSLSAATNPVIIPGLTAADQHPNGCIDCHANEGAGKDYRITTGLAALKGVKHPDISKIVKTVPTDCMMCHKAGGKIPALNIVVHKMHFQNPATNVFVQVYQGSCLNCHKYDQASGVMSVKAAPANF